MSQKEEEEKEEKEKEEEKEEEEKDPPHSQLFLTAIHSTALQRPPYSTLANLLPPSFKVFSAQQMHHMLPSRANIIQEKTLYFSSWQCRLCLCKVSMFSDQPAAVSWLAGWPNSSIVYLATQYLAANKALHDCCISFHS